MSSASRQLPVGVESQDVGRAVFNFADKKTAMVEGYETAAAKSARGGWTIGHDGPVRRLAAARLRARAAWHQQ